MKKLKKLYLKNMCLNFLIKPDFISYDIRALPLKKVDKYRKKHLVLGWTVRSKADFIKAKNYCDNYICENMNDILN